jgi:hypothetical protein
MKTATRKIISKEIQQDADQYVGTYGEIWFQEGDTTLRFGDGETPGGTAITGGGADPLQLQNTGVTFGIWLGDPVKFIKDNYGAQVDLIDTGVAITRGNQQGIYNPLEEEGYDGDVSPVNTAWNADGWNDLSNVINRSYVTWATIMDGNPPGLINQELIMHDTLNDAYYTVKFHTWQSGTGGGGLGGAFSYTRRKINIAAYFTKADEGDQVDLIAPGVEITRGENGGIYNVASEEEWDSDDSPMGTLWNLDGWDDLTDVTTRQYLKFYVAAGSGNLGKRLVGKPFVMKDVINNQYWKILFTRWTPQNNGGGFSWIRERIDVSDPQSGIMFSDGTNQTTAFTQQKLGVIPQVVHEASYDRWLSISDIGKHILVSQTGVDIRIPDYADQAFPVGSAITIVNMSGGDIRVRKDNDDESGTIFGAGTATTATWWSVPDLGGGNICTLIKISQYGAGEGGNGSVWMLSGPGIEEYVD